MLDRLTAGGWSCQVAMYDVILTHCACRTQEQAERSLPALGLAPDQFMIVGDVPEEVPRTKRRAVSLKPSTPKGHDEQPHRGG